MEQVYLPIRSLGDFIITASVIKDNFISRVPVILPPYLDAIFHAIGGDTYFDVRGEIGYQNQPAFFEMYKVKDWANVKRLVDDCRIINTGLNRENEYLLDFRSKRILFTGHRFSWPPANENIYEGKHQMFLSKGLVKTAETPSKNISDIPAGDFTKVLVLPDSRIASKSINPKVVELLAKGFKKATTTVAVFESPGKKLNGQTSYSNFEGLIRLIDMYDVVISAESLPYHLANFLGKPHFVIYNQSRHFKSSFMTPFMLKQQYYTVFKGDNASEVINDINKKLAGGLTN